MKMVYSDLNSISTNTGGGNLSLKCFWRFGFLYVCLMCIFLSSFFETAMAETWSATGSMSTARIGHTATLLPNGDVLVAGGANNTDDNPAFSSAELYSPKTGMWSPTGSMVGLRAWHYATLLPNGKVLVAGGISDGASVNTAEIYDPATGAWTTTGSLAMERHGSMVTLLLDGRVLVTGGAGGTAPTYTRADAEIYDPATGLWSATGSMTVERRGGTITLLADGKVLVAGGWIKYTDIVHASAEIYDPTLGTWTATKNSMSAARRNHMATLLPNGKVLVAGGGKSETEALASAEIYDPLTDMWVSTGSMTTERIGDINSLLPNGKVLVAGGWNDESGILASAELYDSDTGVWTITDSMITGRVLDTATVLLNNGDVLVTGGIYNLNEDSLASAELYDTSVPTCPINLGSDLSFKVDDLKLEFDASNVYHFSANFSYYGLDNNKLLWKLGDFGISSSSCPIDLNMDLSFELSDVSVYDTTSGNINVWAKFEYWGEQSGDHFWFYSDGGVKLY